MSSNLYENMSKKVMFRLCALLLCILSMPVCLLGQSSRDYIKKNIHSWGSCRNVALTDYGGDLALNYTNQYASSGIPRSLANAMEELHDDGEFIDDVQLTENGNWLILFGNNGFRWFNIPSDLEATLRKANNNGEVVSSATFNDYGDWILISTSYIRASTSSIYDWIEEGMKSMGPVWAAHITNDGLVLCYERGYKFMGNVSDKLKNALRASRFNVYRIKFTSNGAYFFADGDGRYDYYM